MIVERIIFGAHRSFAVDNACLKYMMSQIAADGRPGWKGNALSDDAVWSFRARNCQICLRTTESKDEVKLKGKSYNHVQTFFDELVKIRKRFPGLLEDGDRVLNIDWSTVEKEFGKYQIICGGSLPPWRVLPSKVIIRTGKHVTAIIAASAYGRKAPLFFFVAGNLAMQHWIHSRVIFNRTNLIDINLEPLGMQDWFPSEGFIRFSEHGSTEQQNMHSNMPFCTLTIL